ncbi:MAG: glycosyltransferase family 9 protein [Ferruginibacter sp.]|nr:glycosyltransferase family 9 protein [Ferruginibacter sp.]
MKFLIIRFSSIGDIVLTTPVVRCLHKQLPDAEIHFLTKKEYKGIVTTNPYINKVMVLEDNFDEMLSTLEKENYDYIIDLHHNLRTLRVKKHLKKAKAFSFNKLNIEKFIYTNFKINMLPNQHIVDRNLATLESFGIKDDGLGLDYFIPEIDKVKKEDIPTSHQLGYIGIVIGAALATKKMPLQKLIDLCGAIKHPIILLGGKEDYEDGKMITQQDEIKIYNACGKFSLNESADLVRNAKLIITHDTGLMHIAAAFQKPIISIWGNTVPSFGMYPFYGKKNPANYEVVEVQKLWCRPCSKIGYHKCPRGHFKCMNKIDVNEIVKLVTMHLAK